MVRHAKRHYKPNRKSRVIHVHGYTRGSNYVRPHVRRRKR
jgi:hypothetical protein